MALDGIEIMYRCEYSELKDLKKTVAVLSALYDIKGKGVLVAKPFFSGVFLTPEDGPYVESISHLDNSEVPDLYKGYIGQIVGVSFNEMQKHVTVYISKEDSKFSKKYHFEKPFRE